MSEYAFFFDKKGKVNGQSQRSKSTVKVNGQGQRSTVKVNERLADKVNGQAEKGTGKNL